MVSRISLGSQTVAPPAHNLSLLTPEVSCNGSLGTGQLDPSNTKEFDSLIDYIRNLKDCEFTLVKTINLCRQMLNYTSHEAVGRFPDNHVINSIKGLPLSSIIKTLCSRLVESELTSTFYTEHVYTARNGNLAHRNSLLKSLRNFLFIIWNVTDMSIALCVDLHTNGVCRELLTLAKHLGHEDDAPKDNPISEELNKIRLGSLSTLTNVMNNVPTIRTEYKESSGYEIVSKYTDFSDTGIKTKALFFLGLLSDDSDLEFLSVEGTGKYIVENLLDAATSHDHYSEKFGFDVKELLTNILQLIGSDTNKKMLVQEGLLDALTGIVNSELGVTKPEAPAFVDLIWSLAYEESICATLKDESPSSTVLIDKLKDYAQPSGNWDMRLMRAANATLSLLSDDFTQRGLRFCAQRQMTPPISGMKASDVEAQFATINRKPLGPITYKKGHIMLSYSHKCKPIISKIAHRLQERGYKIWWDQLHLTGSTLEGMAKAIEESAVLVMGVCQWYRNSPNCRLEAEYAWRCRKPVLPLLLEKDFQIGGWLGILQGSNMDVNFVDQEFFDESFRVFEVQLRAFVSRSETPEVIHEQPLRELTLAEESQVPEITKPPLRLSTGAASSGQFQIVNLDGWTCDDTTRWIKDNAELQHHADNFSSYSEIHMRELVRMSVLLEAELHFSLRSEMNMILRDRLQLIHALRTFIVMDEYDT